MSYFDVLGGGAFAANPDVRKYGRLAGSAIGAYFATPAIASELGGGAGAGAGAGTAADTAFVPSAASTVPAAGGDAATAAELYGGAASGAGGGVGADIGTTDYAALNAMGVPSAATGAATATGAPVGSTGTVGAEQAGAPVSSVSIPSAGGPGGVSTGAAHAALPTSGGGGVTGISALDKTLATLKANWLPLALQGLGLGISASKGTQPIPNQQQFQGMGETASNAAIQDIQTAQAGQLTGPQQASLDQYIQQAKNQVRQYFSSIGQYDSTERIKAEQQVDQDADGNEDAAHPADDAKRHRSHGRCEYAACRQSRTTNSDRIRHCSKPSGDSCPESARRLARRQELLHPPLRLRRNGYASSCSLDTAFAA